MRAPRIIFVARGVASLVGCTTEGALERPSYTFNRESTFCGSTVAVDANRGLWTEGGCEDGTTRLRFQRTISREQLLRIESAFAAHPDPETFSSTACDGSPATIIRFTQRSSDGSRRDWRVCLPAELVDPFEPEAYPAPFGNTVDAFAG